MKRRKQVIDPRGVKEIPAKPLPQVQLRQCEQCGAQIDITPRRYWKKNMPKHFFCNDEHRDQWLAAQGHFAKMSAKGNASIARIKAETGKVPGPQRGGARPGSGKRKKQHEIETP